MVAYPNRPNENAGLDESNALFQGYQCADRLWLERFDSLAKRCLFDMGIVFHVSSTEDKQSQYWVRL